MKRDTSAIWPTHRRKREQRRRYGRPAPRERHYTLDDVAADLVSRGLATHAILGPMRAPRRNRTTDHPRKEHP